MKKLCAVLIALAVSGGVLSCAAAGDGMDKTPGTQKAIASFEQFQIGRFSPQPFEDMNADIATILPEPDGDSWQCEDGVILPPETHPREVPGCHQTIYYGERSSMYAAWQVEVTLFSSQGGILPLGTFFSLAPPQRLYDSSNWELMAIPVWSIAPEVRQEWYCAWRGALQRYQAAGDDFGRYLALGQLHRFQDVNSPLQEYRAEEIYQYYLDKKPVEYPDYSARCA
ncbi:MAG: hypothetical protein WBA28_03155 [Microbacteriaceae bacterium]